jgi:sialic acid synthase SpsE
MEIKIGKKIIGEKYETYFIADIAANHDGDIERAKKLITLAKESGADATKFQHHDVRHYVSKKGFENLGGKFSHQSKWKKSVFEVYKDAEVPTSWTIELKKHCDKVGIDFFSTPYDLQMVDHLDPHVPAFKIGSGDINFPQMIEKVSRKEKPVLISTGASTMEEIHAAINLAKKYNKEIVLLQCNTNYTGNTSNFKHIHLNVLKKYKKEFPDIILGLSDHTHGGVTAIGAVALGARVIEKHFTDDITRDGPDHSFSMDPISWKKMVDDIRILEESLGDENKKVEENELSTIILQRRCLRANKEIREGAIIQESDFEFKRPSPKGSLSPKYATEIIGKKTLKDISEDDILNWENIQR